VYIDDTVKYCPLSRRPKAKPVYIGLGLVTLASASTFWPRLVSWSGEDKKLTFRPDEAKILA